MSNGLSQIDRKQRIEAQNGIAVIEGEINLLLQQAKTIAGIIHYVDPERERDVFFDIFLNELRSIYKNVITSNFTGNTEPSQAIVYSFLHHLSIILQQFNNKWNALPNYYINDILKVDAKDYRPDKTWISFSKNIAENVTLLPGTRFTWDGAESNNKIYYHLAQKTVVTNACINRAYALHFVKNTEIYPACLLNAPVALKNTELSNNNILRQSLFDEMKVPEKTDPLGLQISSPSLLLREGYRDVTISFYLDDILSFEKTLEQLSKNVEQDSNRLSDEERNKILIEKLLNNIFYLEISTASGWQKIPLLDTKIISSEKPGNDDILYLLKISFSLSEDFPSTTMCNPNLHQIDSEYPVLKIFLNRDSWLYPYCWLKNLNINKIDIQTKVRGLSNILIYNDLGKIDNGSTFSLFGIKAEKGAYFVIGNYEMAIKQIKNIDVHIKWQGLPNDAKGLSHHYAAYKQNIGNNSFKLQYQYLSHTKWREGISKETIFLFSSKIKNRNGDPVSDRELSDESIFKCTDLTEMKPLMITENNYDYNISSQSGFIRFKLTDPEMGFGDKLYNTLFSEQIMKRISKRKKSFILNSPITPLVERMALSYTSSETVDLGSKNCNSRLIVSHIYPLGQASIYPRRTNSTLPFVYSLDSEANILLALGNIKGEEFVNLYFDFFAEKSPLASLEIPSVKWYWGDGYHWEALPDDSVYKNATRNFFNSGEVSIYLPKIPNDSFRDSKGQVWLRAGIWSNKENISGIKQIRINIAKVYRDKTFLSQTQDKSFVLNASEINIPGINLIEQIAPFVGECHEENELAKMIRVSEYISHRGKAVTAKDYERIVLEAFPDVSRIKCICNYDAKAGEKQSGIITLTVVPQISQKYSLPYTPLERLLEIKDYLKERISSAVKNIFIINPLYEYILVRCELFVNKTDYRELSSTTIRTYVRDSINKLIAPWQYVGGTPLFDHAFNVEQLYTQIKQVKQAGRIKQISVIHIYKDTNEKSCVREYTQMNEIIHPQYPHAILIPVNNHTIITSADNQENNMNNEFGVNEMEISENFIICQ